MFKEIRLMRKFAPTIYDEPRVKAILACGHKAVIFVDTEPEIGELYRCSICARIRIN